MGLKDLQMPKSTLEIPGGEFTVRGLSTVELEVLLREHKATLTAMFKQITEVGAQLDDETLQLGIELLGTAPELIARIICMASDEPDAIEFAMKLTPAIQITALTKIALMTFTVEGDLGKLLGGVMSKLGGFNKILTTVSQALEAVAKSSPSSPGYGESVVKSVP
jgi:hypothetical protein